LQVKGELDAALASFQKVLALDPRDPARMNAILILERQGKWPEAIAEYRKAIELNPKNALLHANLGWALTQLARWNDAMLEYQKAIGLDSKSTLAHYRIGYTLTMKGDIQGALAAYQKTLAIDPEHIETLNNLAWLLVTCRDPKLRDPAKAVKLAQKTVDKNSKEGNHWNTLGVAHYRAGEWKAATQALEKSKELLGEKELSFNAIFLAMAHWRLGNKDEARKWYEQAVQWMEKNKPQDEELVRFRAEAEELLGIAKPGTAEPELVPPPKVVGQR
jgi:tetratricopeptide (TPR) repeat protein